MKELLDNAKEWFNGLQPQERLYVAGGGSALLIILIYFLFWEPLASDIDRMQTRIEQQQEDLAWMQDASVRVQQLQRDNGGARRSANQSLLSIVDQSINAAGLKTGLQRMEPEGRTAVKLWFSKTPFDSLITMLGELEEKEGIAISQLSITPTGETGLVEARIALSRGGT